MIALAAIYEIATVWVNFELASEGLGVVIPDLPAVAGACAYIIVTEVILICENLCELNPAIANLRGIKTLQAHKTDSPDLIVGVESIDDEPATHKG